VRRVLSDIAGETVEIEFKIHRPPPRASLQAFHEAEGDEDERPLFRLLAQKQKIADTPSPAMRELVQTPRLPSLPENELNSRFTFERFIISQSNSMAYEAARAVAEYPGTVYNPFMIYGGVGLGK